MPKPNKTMLDQLASWMKTSGRRKPEIIEQTALRDPLGYAIEQRRFGTATGKMPSMTPEREVYQRGLENVRERNIRPILSEQTDRRGELSDIQKEFNRAAREAHAGMRDEYYDRLENYEPANIRGGVYDEEFEIDVPSSNDLRDYWPDDYNSPDWYSDKGAELGEELDAIEDRLDYANSPEYRMELQRQSPRYRRYQDAMMQRAENARLGRVNATIMNLARQGYSIPEIREILKGGR